MTIDLKQTLEAHGIIAHGIIQVGSHYAEEISVFQSLGVKHMLLIEPLNAAYKEMLARIENIPGVETLQVALANRVGREMMYVETVNQGQSSSLLKPKDHLIQHPEIQFTDREEVEVTKMDLLSIDRSLFNGIVIDVQGAELDVFKGAIEVLPGIDFIYSEVNRTELYENCTLIEHLDEFLKEYGFVRVKTSFWGAGGTYGDAIYIKTDKMVYSDEPTSVPAFSEEAYLLHHPDVAEAVKNGMFSSGHMHYERFGKAEGRKWYTLMSTKLHIPSKYQPIMDVVYPEGNIVPFERWFHQWIIAKNVALNRIYLPVHWTAYYVNNKFGTDVEAIAALQSEVIDKLDKTKKYFTICQYDDGILNDLTGLDIIVYASGSNRPGYYPIPLSTEDTKWRDVDYDSKNILYSFTGANTDRLGIRKNIVDTLKDHAPVSFAGKLKADFDDQLTKSIFALCPRGYGPTSFRIAECMQFGCIPVYISDEFVEPFNLPFNNYGIKIPAEQVHLIPDILAKVDYAEFRKHTRTIFNEYFTFENIAQRICLTMLY